MTKQKNDATTTINQPAVSKTAAAAPTPSETAAKAASTTALTPTNVSDGFDSVDDGGSRSIIKGAKIKFTNNAEWVGEDDAR